MTQLPTKNDLRAETRNWLARGVIPSIAAAYRRSCARTFPLIADLHEAYAAEWDRIAAKFPEKVVLTYEAKRDYAVACLANQTPGTVLAEYWQNDAAEWDRLILEIDPAYCPR